MTEGGRTKIVQIVVEWVLTREMHMFRIYEPKGDEYSHFLADLEEPAKKERCECRGSTLMVSKVESRDYSRTNGMVSHPNAV